MNIYKVMIIGILMIIYWSEMSNSNMLVIRNHSEIIHSAFSFLLTVIPVIPQPPFETGTLSVSRSQHFSKSIKCTVTQGKL